MQYAAASDTAKFLAKVDNVSTTEHEVVLTGLSRDMKYFYRVGSTQKILSQGGNQFFTTAPAADTKRPIRFWAMGDFGTADEPDVVVRNNQRTVFEQYLAKRKDPVDLWVWLGDNAYCCGTDSQYQSQVFDFYGGQIFGNLPILSTPGNHEYGASSTGKADREIPYFDIVTTPTKGEAGGIPSGSEAYFSANYSNIHFVSLDSYGLDDGRYLLSDTVSKQYQWLKTAPARRCGRPASYLGLRQ